MANGHKAWTHLFIPDDEVKANRTLDDYVKAFAVTGAGLAREEKEKKRVRPGEEKGQTLLVARRRKGSDPVGGVGVVEFRFDSERASLRPKNRLIAA